VSSWWIILFVIKSTLAACLTNRDHLRIHGLKDLNTQKTATRGGNPFSDIITLYDPPGVDSKAVYASISDNIEKLVEDAIKLRAKYN
jgi:hypothetical protein